MPGSSAIVGVSDHAGWAVLVTAAADGTFLDRRRVELIADGLPVMPYHHDAQKLPLDKAVDLIDRVRVSAEKHSVIALNGVAADVPGVRGIALRKCPDLPPTIAERLQDYRAQNTADWVVYRQALAKAAEARGWSVHWYDAKKVSIDASLDEVRKAIGPPWSMDHKLAMAAAIAAERK